MLVMTIGVSTNEINKGIEVGGTKILILGTGRNRVRLGIAAPKDVPVKRLEEKRTENKKVG